MHRTVAVILALSILVVSCGGDDGPSNPGNGGPGGLSGAQAELVGALFTAGFDGSDFTDESIDNVAGAVEVASIANGVLTFNGTLTETGSGTGEFNWAAGPNDRMVVQFSGGPRFEVFILAFDGFVDGNASDFVDFHSDFRFRIVSPGLADVQVQSESGNPAAPGRHFAPRAAPFPTGPCNEIALARTPSRSTPRSPSAPATTVVFDRRTTGTVVFDGITYTVDIRNQGQRFFEVDGNFSELDETDILSGTIASGGGTITLDDAFRSHLIFNAGEDRLVQNFFREIESSATIGEDTFRFMDVFLRREFLNGRISEPDFWRIEGFLARNGTSIGQFDWSFVPSSGSTGPSAVIRFGDDEVLPL